MRSRWHRNWCPRPVPPSINPGTSAATTKLRSRRSCRRRRVGRQRRERVVGNLGACRRDTRMSVDLPALGEAHQADIRQQLRSSETQELSSPSSPGCVLRGARLSTWRGSARCRARRVALGRSTLSPACFRSAISRQFDVWRTRCTSRKISVPIGTSSTGRRRLQPWRSEGLRRCRRVGFELGVAEIDERVDVRAGRHEDRSAMAPVAAARRHEARDDSRRNARQPRPPSRRYVDIYFVNEHQRD